MRDQRPVRRVLPNGYGEPRWPATIPAVGQILEDELDLPAGVTLLSGENGSGKSTIVEAVAMAYGLSPKGGSTPRASTASTNRWCTGALRDAFVR